MGPFVQPVSIPRFICNKCAKFIPNRSSRFTTFPSLLNCWPPNPPPPQCHPGVSWGQLFLAYVHSQMNPQTYTKFGANRSSRLAAFPNLHLWPHKKTEMPPGVLRGELNLAYDHSQTNAQTCTKFGANRSSRLTASPDLNVWPPYPPPEMPPGMWGKLYFAYVHSQTNPQTCTKCGANRSSRLTASPDFWICVPLTPSPRNAPWVI